MRSINISDCHQSSEVDSWRFPGQLTVLKLGQPHNSYTSSKNSIPTLPETICHLRHLTCLVACDINLMQIPESLSIMISLRELDLRQNSLSWLPNAIGKLTNLEIVRLSNNCFDGYMWRTGIMKLPRLKTLLLSENIITWIPDQDVAPSLAVIDLYGNQLDKDGILPLANLPKLTRIDLAENDISLKEIREISNMENYMKMQEDFRLEFDVQDRCPIRIDPIVYQEKCDDDDPISDSYSSASDNDDVPDSNSYKECDNNEEEDDWDQDLLTSPVLPIRVDYDFNNMSKYSFGGQNKFCPSDIHAKTIGKQKKQSNLIQKVNQHDPGQFDDCD